MINRYYSIKQRYFARVVPEATLPNRVDIDRVGFIPPHILMKLWSHDSCWDVPNHFIFIHIE